MPRAGALNGLSLALLIAATSPAIPATAKPASAQASPSPARLKLSDIPDKHDEIPTVGEPKMNNWVVAVLTIGLSVWLPGVRLSISHRTPTSNVHLRISNDGSK